MGTCIDEWWDCWDEYHDVEKTESNICKYNKFVIGKCRGVTPLDWGSCKKYVTSDTECIAHPECVWEKVASEHTKPIVEVHWLAVEKTEEGVLGAYPFIAGDTQVGDEATVSFDAGFTQVPLVYGSVSGEATADLRLTSKAVGNFSLTLQGAAADEKASYFVYNGQSAIGTAFKAVGSEVSYAYETAEFGECVEDEPGSLSGTRTRTVDCKRSDGETAEDYYCMGAKPAETEACVTESLFIMSQFGGNCLGPAGGGSAEFKTELSARVEKCDGEKNKFKIESGKEGFVIKNTATGLYYCEKKEKGVNKGKMIFRKNPHEHLCEFKKEDETPDGTFILVPIGRKCIRTMHKTHSKVHVSDQADNCGTDGNRFTFVREGPIEVEGYYAELSPDIPAKATKAFKDVKDLPKEACDISGTFAASRGQAEVTLVGRKNNPCKGKESAGAWKYTVSGNTITIDRSGVTGTISGIAPARTIHWSNNIIYTEKHVQAYEDGWFDDHTGEMLTDGEKMEGDFPATKEGQKGVGWLSSVAIDFKLKEPSAIQAVNVGFTYKKKWQVKKPKKIQVQCSSDGSTFGNSAEIGGPDIEVKPRSDYEDKKGGRWVMSLQVRDICDADTTTFRVIVTPQAGDKEKKAVIDEITAFSPYTLA